MKKEQSYSVDQIADGSLVDEMNEGLRSCVEDVQRDEGLKKPRKIEVHVSLTPDGNGHVKISYHVTPKLAKREGEEEGYIDKEGQLKFGEPQVQMQLPHEAATENVGG